MKLKKWSVVAGLGLLLGAGSARGAFVSLENMSQVGDVVTWDVVYDPDGSAGVASLQQNIGIAGDVGNISDVSGTDSGVLNWTVDGFSDIGAEVIYGGVNFNADTPTPGAVVLGTFSVTWNGLGSVDIVNALSEYLGFGPPAFDLPDTTQAVLATLGGAGPCDDLGGDSDGDTICGDVDNCPITANTDQADGDGDNVGDVCDNCTVVFNPRVASPEAWMTLTGGQRDDDGDGYGNLCDAKFTAEGTNVGQTDVQEFVASLGKDRTTSTCGTSGTDSCARYDLNEGPATNISQPDVTVFIGLLGKLPGPRCAGCPLP